MSLARVPPRFLGSSPLHCFAFGYCRDGWLKLEQFFNVDQFHMGDPRAVPESAGWCRLTGVRSLTRQSARTHKLLVPWDTCHLPDVVTEAKVGCFSSVGAEVHAQ